MDDWTKSAAGTTLKKNRLREVQSRVERALIIAINLLFCCLELRIGGMSRSCQRIVGLEMHLGSPGYRYNRSTHSMLMRRACVGVSLDNFVIGACRPRNVRSRWRQHDWNIPCLYQAVAGRDCIYKKQQTVGPRRL